MRALMREDLMKKHGSRKLLALTLAVALSAAVFTGCSIFEYDEDKDLNQVILEIAPELLLQNIRERHVIELIRTLGHVGAAVHALHHGGDEASPGQIRILSRARAKPAVALQAQTGAKDTLLRLDTPLNKEVIAENLRHGPFLLQLFTLISNLLRIRVEKVEGSTIGVE